MCFYYRDLLLYRVSGILLAAPKYLYQTILLDISTFRGYQTMDRNVYRYIYYIGNRDIPLIPSKLSGIF
jgi:hypothetical protein